MSRVGAAHDARRTMGSVCGRYVSAGDLADLSVLMGANPFAADADPRPGAPERERTTRERRFGLAPTDPVPAVLPGSEPGTRQLTLLDWTPEQIAGKHSSYRSRSGSIN